MDKFDKTTTGISAMINILFESLDDIRIPDKSCGRESEYTISELFNKIFEILKIIQLHAENDTLKKYLTYNERLEVLRLLHEAEARKKKFDELVNTVDELVKYSRLLPFSKQSELIDFENLASYLARQKDGVEQKIQLLQEYALEGQKSITKIEKAYSEVNRLKKENTEKNTQHIRLVSEVSNLKREVSQYLKESEDNRNKIKDYTDSIHGQYIEIDDIYKSISVKKREVNALQNKVNQFSENMDSYEATYNKYETRVKEIINEALTALNYSHAKGISEALETEKSNKQKEKNWLWLVSAGICFMITISLGIWLILCSGDQLSLVLIKIAITPLPILGAIYSVKQYITQKNVITDYGYKIAIAKSIVNFSEQLSKMNNESEEYKSYITLALREIHRHPLKQNNQIVNVKQDYSKQIATILTSIIDKYLPKK